jgi:hypothetical protein
MLGARWSADHISASNFAHEIERGAQFLTAFRGNAAALLGADHVAAGGSQRGLLNGKVLIRSC